MLFRAIVTFLRLSRGRNLRNLTHCVLVNDCENVIISKTHKTLCEKTIQHSLWQCQCQVKTCQHSDDVGALGEILDGSPKRFTSVPRKKVQPPVQEQI